MAKRRGSQRGVLLKRGPSWIVRYRRHVVDGDQILYRATSEVVGRCIGPDRISKAEARLAADRIVSIANEVAAVPRMQATLQQFIDTCFEPEHIASMRTEGGKQHYRYLLKEILPAFGGMKLVDITPRKVQMLLSSKAATLSVATVRHIRNALTVIFKRAEFLGFWPEERSLPTKGVKCYGRPPRKVLALSPLQVELIIEHLPAKYRPLVRLLAATGMRIGEAMGLLWSRVNLTESPVLVDNGLILPKNSIYVDRSYRRRFWGPPKSEKSQRVIPMSSAAYVALQQMRDLDKDGGPDDPVFRAPSGVPWDAVNFSQRYFAPACVKAGVPWAHVHCLRHSFASTPGLDASVRRALLGHSKDLHDYVHADHERARAQVEVVN